MKYVRLFGITTLIIAAVLYMAADKEEAYEGPYVSAEEHYEAGDFSKINLNIRSSQAVVRVGEPYSIEIKADPEDLKNIELMVEDGIMTIKKKKRSWGGWHGGNPEVAISLPYLERFSVNGSSDAKITGIESEKFFGEVNGAGDLSFEGKSGFLFAAINGSGDLRSHKFDADQAQVQINGSGDIVLKGACRHMDVKVNGSGDVNARNFKCEDVDVGIHGFSDLSIFASSSVEANVSGNGEIQVYGNPAKVRDHSRRKKHLIIHK